MQETLIMLGTGNATVTKCYNTCFAIQEEQEYFLVDTGGGNGILAQLEKASIPLQNIHNIYISHEHIDHLLGIIWLIRVIATKMKQNQYKGTVTAIKNAWENSTSLDNTGQLWIDTDNLHTILRTSKGNARYIASSISEDSKISYKKKVFVRGYEIIKLLDKLIQESGPSTKNDYLRYSEKYYAALRDSDKGKLLRANAEKALL